MCHLTGVESKTTFSERKNSKLSLSGSVCLLTDGSWVRKLGVTVYEGQ
jgi:hypothetical protein